MGNASGCKAKEIVIIGEDDAILAKREGDMVFVARAKKAGLGARRNIDLPAPQTMSNRVGHVLVEMETEHKLAPGLFCPMLVKNARSSFGAQFVHECVVLSHFGENLFPVIMKIRESRVDLAER